MKIDRFKTLRVLVVITLILLFFQYELGMSINLSPNLPQLTPFGFSLARIVSALDQVGVEALAHAGLGTILVLLSILTLMLSLHSKMRSVQVVGVLCFLTILLAMIGGILFSLSGFQQDNFSLMMASNFILAFTFHFLQLYFIKPASKIQQ